LAREQLDDPLSTCRGRIDRQPFAIAINSVVNDLQVHHPSRGGGRGRDIGRRIMSFSNEAAQYRRIAPSPVMVWSEDAVWEGENTPDAKFRPRHCLGRVRCRNIRDEYISDFVEPSTL